MADEAKELTFVAIATEEMAVVAERWEPTIEYISEKAGVKINFFASTSYAAAVEALLNDFADFGMLGPKIYTVARAKTDKIEPIVGTGRPPNHFLKEPCACYHGRLITKKGGKFETIESLKGAVLALTDPGSTSGNALPAGAVPGGDWRHVARRLLRRDLLRRQPRRRRQGRVPRQGGRCLRVGERAVAVH